MAIRDTSAQDIPVAVNRRRRLRRAALGIASGAVVAIATAVVLTGWRDTMPSANASRLRIAPVTRGTLVRDAAVNGRVVAAVSPTLYAPAAGTLSLRVKAGDTVKRGDVLAQVDSPDLADQLKREESTYEEMQAGVARQRIVARKQKLLAQRDADTAEIERVSAQRTYERIEKAGIAGVVAKNDFMKAQDAMRSTQVRARHAAQAAALEDEDVVLELKAREAQLARQGLAVEHARRRVEALAIRAPADGFVGSVAVADRSVVPANASLLTLVDLSVLEVELEIPESYATDLGLGMAVEVTTPEGKAAATLASLAPEVVRNQVLARVRFTGATPANLRQSQRVSARLLIEEKANVLTLPRGPFVEAGGGRVAYVVSDGVAERRPIRLGGTSVTSVEIVEGLAEGDRVIVAGTDAFENAQRISINP